MNAALANLYWELDWLSQLKSQGLVELGEPAVDLPTITRQLDFLDAKRAEIKAGIVRLEEGALLEIDRKHPSLFRLIVEPAF